MREVLTVRGLRSGYDGSTVLHGVDLAVREGQVVALLGRNGVGKTTWISPSPVCCAPTPVRSCARRHRLRRCSSGRRRAGRSGPCAPGSSRVRPVDRGRAPGHRLTRPPGRLDPRNRAGPAAPPRRASRPPRRPAVGRRAADARHRAGAAAGPARAAPLDEPSDGLAPAVVSQVGEVVHQVCSTGMSVLVVEQDLRLAFGVSDRVAVMEKGRIVLDTTTADFRSDAARAKALLGLG